MGLLLILSITIDINGVLAQHERRMLPVLESQSMVVGDPLGFGN